MEPKYPCPDCCGTGRDVVKTAARPDGERKHIGGYIVCNTCMGNGLDNAEYFRLGKHEGE